MSLSFSTLAWKLRENGLRWGLKRVQDELRAPHSNAGKLVQKVRRHIDIIYNTKSFIHTLFKTQTDTITAVYGLAVCPVTYDFATFLVIADMCRQMNGYKNLCVVVVPGFEKGLRQEESCYEAIVPYAARRWRLSNILLPLTDLLPSCKETHFFESRKAAEKYLNDQASTLFPKTYSIKYPVAIEHGQWCEFFKKGATPRVLRGTEQARTYVNSWLAGQEQEGRKLITINLREYEYGRDRNSRREDWLRFAHSLDPKHYMVAVVPDVEKAFEFEAMALGNIRVFEAACWNMHLRMALYEAAFVNMFVNSGPASLCYFSDIPYIMTKIMTETVPQANLEALVNRGYRPGCDPAYVGDNQMWVWKDDTEEVLKEALAEFERRQKSE